MTLIQKFKNRFCNTCLSNMWHCVAPSFTVSKRFFGLRVFFDSRDNIDDVSRSTHELENREQGLLLVPRYVSGDVWDVGANVGLFTVSATLAGKKCVAFELAPKACQLMQKTKQYNGLDFVIVDRALTIEPMLYADPGTSSAENSLTNDLRGDLSSMTFREAVQTFGCPGLIKMDIEGGELEFFESDGFKMFMREHGTVWLVEVHGHKIGRHPQWNDVPRRTLRSNHELYCYDEEKLVKMIDKLDNGSETSHSP